MSENTIDQIPGPEDEAETEGSESGVRTLILLGISFIAGYLVGKSRSTSNFREELGEFNGAEGGPMEIEIHDTDDTAEDEEDDAAADDTEEGGDETDDDEAKGEANDEEEE